MRLSHQIRALALAALAAAPLLAGSCVRSAADQITAGDLASAIPVLSAIPADTPLFNTPDAGVTRILSTVDTRQVARTYKIDVPAHTPVCIERESGELALSVVQAALDRAIKARPGASATARYRVLRYEPVTAPPGSLMLSSSGPIAAPIADGVNVYIWGGAYSYGNKRSLPFRVWVDISSTAKCLAATRQIEAGQEITAQDAALLDVATGLRTTSCIADLASLRGAVARRAIAAGQPLLREHIRVLPLIQRGDAVSVLAHSGGARITVDATALTNGALGDTVFVQFANSRTRVKARVVNRNKVEINAGGPHE